MKFKEGYLLILLIIISLFTKAQTNYSRLFQVDSVATLKINIDEVNWQFLTNDPERKDYVPAKISGFEETLDSVGIRFKGSYGTLWSCVDEQNNITCNKLSLKLDFNLYKKGQNFLGFKKFNLHSMTRDPSKMREKLAYDLYREVGIPAPLTTWVRVFINGKNYGVYALIEQIDNQFLKRNWGNSDGFLFKEAYPNNMDTNYLMSHQKNHKSVNGTKPYLDFAQNTIAANEKADLNKHINMANWVTYLAVEQLINNWDGITTFYCSPMGICNPHNFYWYVQDGKFEPIIWDVDLTFGVKEFWKNHAEWYEDVTNCNIVEYPGGAFLRSSQCDGLLQFTKKYYFEEYKNQLQSLISNKIVSGDISKKIEQYKNLLAPLLKDELNEKAWKMEVDKLENNIYYLAEKERLWLTNKSLEKLKIDFSQPQTFESWQSLKVTSELSGNYSVGSSVKSSISQNNLIAEFEISNQLDGSNGWAILEIPVKSGSNLNLQKALVFNLKTNWNGPMNITLNSENYTKPDVSEYFGWNIFIDENTTQIILKFDEIELQKWANVNQNSSLQEVLNSVSGIQISPFKQHDEKLQNPIRIEISKISVLKD